MTDERDSQGRFLKGCKGGPGNPHLDAMKKFRSEMFAAVKDGDVAAVVSKCIEQAKEGSAKHQQLMLEILGLRVRHVEATIDDGNQKSYVAIAIDRV